MTNEGDQDVARSEANVVRIADSGGGREVSTLPPFLRHLDERDHAQDIRLKKIYALSLLAGLGIQLLIADGVFVAYGWVGEQWKISEPVMSVWLGATVIQVIGIILVVANYLFPHRQPSEATASIA